jgi:hypothetical protein
MVEWVPNQFPLIGAARRGDYYDNPLKVRYFLWEGLLVNRILTTTDFTKPPLRRREFCDHRLRGGPRSPNFLTADMPIALIGEFPVLPPTSPPCPWLRQPAQRKCESSTRRQFVFNDVTALGAFLMDC